MSDEKPRRSSKNLPYPENESCLDAGCLKYGAGCCGADLTGEQCSAEYCQLRVDPPCIEGQKTDRELGIYTACECPVCESHYYDDLKLSNATNYTMHSQTEEIVSPDGTVIVYHVCPRLQQSQIFIRRAPKDGMHWHGIPGKCGATIRHPIGRKHRKPRTEVPR